MTATRCKYDNQSVNNLIYFINFEIREKLFNGGSKSGNNYNLFNYKTKLNEKRIYVQTGRDG